MKSVYKLHSSKHTKYKISHLTRFNICFTFLYTIYILKLRLYLIVSLNFSTSLKCFFVLIFVLHFSCSFFFSVFPSPPFLSLFLSLSRSRVNISSDFEVVHWWNSPATKAIPCWSVSNQNTLELYLEVIVCLSFGDCRFPDCYWRAKTTREHVSQKRYWL